jgi:hypothetical protein
LFEYYKIYKMPGGLIFEDESSSDDEVVKKLYAKLKKDMTIQNTPGKSKRAPKQYKDEETANRMKEVLKAGREKAYKKRMENKAAREAFKEETGKAKTVSKAKPREPEPEPEEEPPARERKPERAERVEPVRKSDPIPISAPPTPSATPIRLLMRGNNSKFWYS